MCYCCEYAKYVDGSDIYCIKQNHFFNKFRIACDELEVKQNDWRRNV